MNRSKLKSYAPKARRDFIGAVTDRAARFGITENRIEPAHEQGDAVVILGSPYPRSVGEQRKKLLRRIEINGFDQVMEEIAYTWFNRFAAIRFMEVNGYLDHGLRVLSHPAGKAIPEILEKAELADLPGLLKAKVLEMKLDGRSDAELYRLLLVAQCNALHKAMPFLFERIDDETELLLPDNLLHSDSVIRQLVEATDEADWRQIEIIGWLYQFYIAEKKDQVIGKVVRSEDIPAATQLFTPNWIVKYMVQNSLGAKWLATYPDSALKAKMEYYIEPAELEVEAQLAAITPKSLDPEAITLMDPACGSGHILIEAYNLFREIYLERGYQTRDIPRLILEKNLYGLEICDRAAQLAGFAVLMRARRDHTKILESPPKLNILAIQSSKGLDAKQIARELLREERVELVPSGDLLPETLAQPTLSAKKTAVVTEQDIRALLALFEDAKTFGSLIQVPQVVLDRLLLIEEPLARPAPTDLLQRQAFEDAREQLAPLLAQAKLLGSRYDCVVANPPYMGSKGMNPRLKKFAQDAFPDSKSDLFAMFIERGLDLVSENGLTAMVTMESWMFLSSYTKLRRSLLKSATVQRLIHMPYEGRSPTAMGISFGVCAFVMKQFCFDKSHGAYSRLRYLDLRHDGTPNERRKVTEPKFWKAQKSFGIIPGSTLAFDASDKSIELFKIAMISRKFSSGGRCKTSNDDLFLRRLWEVPYNSVGIDKEWCLLSKGGDFRKYFGNIDTVIRWSDASKAAYLSRGGLTRSEFWDRPGVTWTIVSSKGSYSFRRKDAGTQYNSVSPTIFGQDDEAVLAYLNGKVASNELKIIAPTLAANVGEVLSLPYQSCENEGIRQRANTLIKISRKDWDASETSWDFSILPLLYSDNRSNTLPTTYDHLRAHWQGMTEEMRRLEEENNRLFIDAYGLADELTPEVPLREITLTCNPHYRYGGEMTDAEREERLQRDTMRELISYAVGCMMGRYSLDEPGLLYAHAGNQGFNPGRYKIFPADADGIVPVTDLDWFADDAANRFVEFLKMAWPAATLAENLAFVAESLGAKSGETPVDTIRRYLSQSFFKDHLQTYKRRPIYWLFSSGKQKAFEALVYLHRYNEGTLARLRMAYVTPLMAMLRGRIEQLDDQAKAASSTAAARKLEKSRSRLLAKQTELVEFDEKLRHYADQRITLDLDDGVKVNYAKFGDLLAEVKAVTGQKEE